MLRTLLVQNYALIDSLQMELGAHLNIITGETGAGKSILLGALGLLLGNRADSGVLKGDGSNCVVEGTFDIGDYALEEFFAANDLDYAPQTVIRRVISPAGKSRAYVNDLPVQQATLKELGASLIDIHSQHQNLMLESESFRTGILDSVAGNGTVLGRYKTLYAELRAARRELERMRSELEHGKADQQWLEFQVAELKAAALKEGEQQELEAEQSVLSHAEDICTALSSGTALMDEEETGILPRLKQLRQALRGINEFYPRGEEFAERINCTLIELRDIERELEAEAGRVESDPQRLELVSARLDMIYFLQQKHRVQDMAALIALRDEYEQKLSAITLGDSAIAELEAKIASQNSKAVKLAADISASRKKAASEVSAFVENVLAELGMPGARFRVDISPVDELRTSGADEIRFMFSANKNVAPAPVEKIASGGEISRLMLALKSLAARKAKLPTIIFDEIDSGVSGPIADAMGRIIQQLATNMQVLNITHLPQVASKGDTHFVVYKDSCGPTTRTMITCLSAEQRVDEIAKMLSGSAVTEAARTQARLLLRQK